MTTCKAFKNCKNEATTTAYQTAYVSGRNPHLVSVPCCERCARELSGFSQFAKA